MAHFKFNDNNIVQVIAANTDVVIYEAPYNGDYDYDGEAAELWLDQLQSEYEESRVHLAEE